MKQVRNVTILVLLILAARAAVARDVTPAARASGLGVNLPVLGRTVGGGNTLFISTVDVTNHGPATQVDFYLDGTDVTTGVPILKEGSISGSGALVALGTGTKMNATSTAHFDDFIDALVVAKFLDPSVRTNGFLGSILFVFNGFTRSGQGTATVRFYNSLAGGTVGVSLKGRELTTSEPQRLVAAVLDTRASTKDVPKVYPNLFVNNTGVPASGSGTAGTVTVVVSAKANGTGASLGTPVTIADLAPGRTVVISQLFNALQVPASAGEKILVYATVTSGNAAIAGVISQVDATTRDGSVFEMSRADF